MSFTIADIRIEGLEELIVDIERMRRAARFRWPNELMDRSAEIMAEAIEVEAPKGPTGELSQSVRIETAPDMRRVVVDSPYGVYVNEGTGPSPGRYVPAIGRRLTNPIRDIGIHPGIRATHFFENAIETATPIIWAMYDQYMLERWMELGSE